MHYMFMAFVLLLSGCVHTNVFTADHPSKKFITSELRHSNFAAFDARTGKAIPIEESYLDHDPRLEGAMMGAEVTPLGVSVLISHGWFFPQYVRFVGGQDYVMTPSGFGDRTYSTDLTYSVNHGFIQFPVKAGSKGKNSLVDDTMILVTASFAEPITTNIGAGFAALQELQNPEKSEMKRQIRVHLFSGYEQTKLWKYRFETTESINSSERKLLISTIKGRPAILDINYVNHSVELLMKLREDVYARIFEKNSSDPLGVLLLGKSMPF